VYVQVYMENIRDLLSSAAEDESIKLEVRHGAQGSYIPGLTEVVVHSTDEAYSILQRGSEARRCATTSMNERSSRSHCMLCVRVRGRSKLTGL
jgi:kinesin family member C2/C3